MNAPRSMPTPAPALAAGAGRAERQEPWLRQMDGSWLRAASRWLDHENTLVRVLVTHIRGSTPREPGACMLVGAQGIAGTIGGGNLEWQAMQAARELLADAAGPAVRLRRLVLGPELGQCCGGVVHLWLERFTRADLPLLRHAARAAEDAVVTFMATEVRGTQVLRRLCDAEQMQSFERDWPASSLRQGRVVLLQNAAHECMLLERIDAAAQPLWMYGAGHVGQALVRTLAGLPFAVTWIDSRAALLPADLPANVRALSHAAPVATVPDAPPGAYFLVLTHDHALDYALCRAILERGDSGWLGLIGSGSKSARFRSRLARDDVGAERIARLVCPIGVQGMNSKLPAAIAIGVAAQLMQCLGTQRGAEANRQMQPLPQECSSETCGSCPSQRRVPP